MYAELHCISNFTFLRGASRPEELVETAARLGYEALAITDECSLAGVVKAHVAAKALNESGHPIKLIIGSEFTLPDTSKLIALAPDKSGYEALSAYISLCRRRSIKGEYQLKLSDLGVHLQHNLLIWIPAENAIDDTSKETPEFSAILARHPALWIGYQRLLTHRDEHNYQLSYRLACTLNKPMVACGNIHMHSRNRKRLQDTLTAIRLCSNINTLGSNLLANSENHLRPLTSLSKLYPEPLLEETRRIADQCHFSLDELRYQYPRELVPTGQKPSHHLRQLVLEGAAQRWPNGISKNISKQIEHEMTLIVELNYEYYFLTVYDIVRFARDQGILCQGRGSAANSVVCYCLFITEVNPAQITLLFERFISRERNEPPDIDVDFEHERREEIIQYIYKKYTRQRAALAATVITYRSRSAIRDVGKALGLNSQLIEKLSRSLGWWSKPDELEKQFYQQIGSAKPEEDPGALPKLFMQLVREIIGFPRHLSQHVGGFIISDGPVSRLVPVENASMPERTIIQWDKEDIEALGLLKVDVLALGMLSAIRKMLTFVNSYPASDDPAGQNKPLTLAGIPTNDSQSYELLCQADSIGIFQVESRAQISMLPRLKPRCFYDLVIQVAIVRPGPIQGNMVHPFLRRREKTEAVTYENDAIREVLDRTLGVPIFQEQVIKLAMVAAGFSGGEADQLRRAMASWGKNGNLLQFRDKLLQGMLARGYSEDFAERLFEQMKGFGSYGFPESHAASFALLVYISAWFKTHHPAAFYAAIINSQPMGFYSPSQLIQDARRHNIEVHPIDVTTSHWNCTLELSRSHAHSIRLGLRLIKGLSEATANRLYKARTIRPFQNLADLIQRAKLDQHEREVLIRANATTSITGNRHQSHWQNLAVNQAQTWEQTFSETQQQTDSRVNLDDDVILTAPSEVQDIRADYAYTGLTLERHPMQILREKTLFRGCKRSIDLQQVSHKRFVTVAGIVTGRQRPGTETGVIFLTLEDETGNINVVVWRDRQQQNRNTLLKSKLLMVKGVLERKGQVMHVIAGQLIDYSDHLKDFLLPSRDFH